MQAVGWSHGSLSLCAMWLEDRILLSSAPANPSANAPLLLPASVMHGAAPISIGSIQPGSLAEGGDAVYEIEPGSDGRLIAQTQATAGSPRAAALALRRPGQPAGSERRPVIRTSRPVDRSACRRTV